MSDAQTILAKAINDSRIDPPTLGVLTFIIAQGEDYPISVEHLRQDMKSTPSFYMLRKALRNLREAGYIILRSYQDLHGHWKRVQRLVLPKAAKMPVKVLFGADNKRKPERRHKLGWDMFKDAPAKTRYNRKTPTKRRHRSEISTNHWNASDLACEFFSEYEYHNPMKPTPFTIKSAAGIFTNLLKSRHYPPDALAEMIKVFFTDTRLQSASNPVALFSARADQLYKAVEVKQRAKSREKNLEAQLAEDAEVLRRSTERLRKIRESEGAKRIIAMRQKAQREEAEEEMSAEEEAALDRSIERLLAANVGPRIV